MTGPFSQKPWHPVLLMSMVCVSPRFSSSLCSESRTFCAPEALQPLPAQTEMHGREVSRASRQRRISLTSSGDLNLRMACLPRDFRFVRLLIVFLKKSRHLGLGEVGMGVGVIDARHRR